MQADNNALQPSGDNFVSQSNMGNDLLSQSLGDNFAIGGDLIPQPLGVNNKPISPTTSPVSSDDLLEGLSLSPVNITQPLSPQSNSNRDARVVDLMGDMMNSEVRPRSGVHLNPSFVILLGCIRFLISVSNLL